jgi:hypothetical protein
MSYIVLLVYQYIAIRYLRCPAFSLAAGTLPMARSLLIEQDMFEILDQQGFADCPSLQPAISHLAGPPLQETYDGKAFIRSHQC